MSTQAVDNSARSTDAGRPTMNLTWTAAGNAYGSVHSYVIKADTLLIKDADGKELWEHHDSPEILKETAQEYEDHWHEDGGTPLERITNAMLRAYGVL